MTRDVRCVTAEREGWKRCTSVAEVRRLSAAAFDTNDLDLLRSGEPFEVRFRLGHVGPLTFGDITYGADVRLDCRNPSSGYRMTIPVDGVVEARHQGKSLPASPDLAAVYPPWGETVLARWPAHCRTIAVKIDEAAVDRALARECRTHPTRTGQPGFLTNINMKEGAGRSFQQLLLTVGRLFADTESLLHHPLVAAPFAESIVKGFLVAAHPACADAWATPNEPVQPGVVREASELITSYPQFPWTTDTLAQRCRVRPRTLQNSFRRQLGTTPMAYVRTVRLRRAHEELKAADPHDTTVAFIACDWGFTHLGRFGAAYKKVYNETPGETLRGKRRTRPTMNPGPGSPQSRDARHET